MQKMREQIFYDIPREWIENRNHKLCPVCAKTKNEFEKGRKVYCSEKCQKEFNSKILIWSNFKNQFLQDNGEKCVKCSITKDDFNKEKKEKLAILQQEYISTHREQIEHLKTEISNEIESLAQMLDDEDKLMKSRGHYLHDFPSEYRYTENISFEVDHIVALKNGGKMWDKHNLQVLCNKCHRKKTNIDLKIDMNNKTI